MVKYFEFRQNNSFGEFENNAKYVFVAADNSDEANKIAEEETFIYFDGCSYGIDCSCCGDRWYYCSEDGFIEADSQNELIEKFWLQNDWLFHPYEYSKDGLRTKIYVDAYGNLVEDGENWIMPVEQKIKVKSQFLWGLDIVVFENDEYMRYGYVSE